MTRQRFFLLLCSITLLCLSAAGCGMRHMGASQHSFVSSLNPQVFIQVDPALSLLAHERQWTSIPSDVNLEPNAMIDLAVYTHGGGVEPGLTAVAMEVKLPKYMWRFAVESEIKKSMLAVQKYKKDGQFWTARVSVLAKEKDWLSPLWEQAPSAPDFWLVKRWSCTPYYDIRVIAELRKPAPPCIAGALQRNPLATGQDLAMQCRDEVEAFQTEADVLVQTSRYDKETALQPVLGSMSVLPKGGRLLGVSVGETELLEHDSDLRVND